MNRKITLAALAVALGAGALGAIAPANANEPGRRGERIFTQADANKDGRVTADEAWASLSSRFAQIDANKDNGVTWEEFRAHTQSRMEARQRQRAENRPQQQQEAKPEDRRAPHAHRLARMEQRGQGFFRAIDADRDGKVTVQELRPFADAMFRARDVNGDNALTQDELRSRHGHGHGRGHRQQQQKGSAPQQL